MDKIKTYIDGVGQNSNDFIQETGKQVGEFVKHLGLGAIFGPILLILFVLAILTDY